MSAGRDAPAVGDGAKALKAALDVAKLPLLDDCDDAALDKASARLDAVLGDSLSNLGIS